MHEAFNLGCVVICTKFDAYSDPTLKKNYNCLVSKISKDIVNNINYLMNNKKYYEIQKSILHSENELNTSKIVQEYLKDIKKIKNEKKSIYNRYHRNGWFSSFRFLF